MEQLHCCSIIYVPSTIPYIDILDTSSKNSVGFGLWVPTDENIGPGKIVKPIKNASVLTPIPFRFYAYWLS